MSRKVCIVTGTRAEYGLLRWLIEDVEKSPDLQLQLVVTGMHLSPEFGSTWRAIEKDGFSVDRKVEMLLSSDSTVGIAKSMGLGTIGFADVFSDLDPDIVVLLGDRFEALAAATAAMVQRIPIAHIHGGEITEGAIDDAMRHSLTKMSHVHFVANEIYRKRVIQMGERPDTVHVVGGLGLDSIDRLQLLSKNALEAELGINFRERNLLITFHPETLGDGSTALEFGELLAALEAFRETGLIFTMPNADADSRVIVSMLEDFVSSHGNASLFKSLGQLRYLSCMNIVDGVVGNSSSGLLEAPSLKRATVNIGSRQDGRLKAASIVDCAASRVAIENALRYIFTDEYQASLADVVNPYGSPGGSAAILRNLCNVKLEGILKKKFFDLA
jgi:GDP/UDP-N,N'-diacetylbacillosamine 2-epimerase (hydrolysing)